MANLPQWTRTEFSPEASERVVITQYSCLEEIPWLEGATKSYNQIDLQRRQKQQHFLQQEEKITKAGMDQGYFYINAGVEHWRDGMVVFTEYWALVNWTKETNCWEAGEQTKLHLCRN